MCARIQFASSPLTRAVVFFHLEKAGVNLSDGWNANGNERHKPHAVATPAIDENAFCDGENGPRATCGGSKAQVVEATTTDRPHIQLPAATFTIANANAATRHRRQ